MIKLFQLPSAITAALLAAALLPSIHVAAGPSVSVSLKAAFPSPPYLVELLETAGADNATTYFALLDGLANGQFADAKTDKQLYDRFLEVLRQGQHMDAESLSSFKLALSMRSAAPRIEAHYQYYRTAVEPSLSGAQDHCANWALHNEKQYCDEGFGEGKAIASGSSQRRILPFDRVEGAAGPHDIILYADITSPEFPALYKSAKAREGGPDGSGSFRLRYKRGTGPEPEALPVNGYGVELALKRTDYIVIDDREADEGEKQQNPGNSEVSLDDEENVTDLKPLSTSELSSLGMKAASFIMQSDSPFETLIKLTQDFPKYSTSLAAHNISAEFETEHEGNRQHLVPSGTNVLWMNGVQMIERQIQPFTLVDMLRKERKLINGVLDLGLSGKEAVALLGHSEVAKVKSSDEARRFDWRDEAERGQVIIWLNDIEKDKRYEEYPKSLMSLLQPTMPGQIPPVRRDMFNLLIPVDFSKEEDVILVSDQLLGFVKRMIPIRFGLVPLTPTGEAIEQAKTIYHIVENYGLAALSSYLEQSLQAKEVNKPSKTIFDKVAEEGELRPDATPLAFSDILTSEYHEEQVHLAKHWTERLNANTEIPPVFFNGLPIPRTPSWLQTMSMSMGLDLRKIQEGLFYGQIEEDMWLPGLFLEQAASRRNIYIFPEDPNALTILDVNKVYTEHAELFSKIPVIEADADSTKDDWATLTLIGDLDNIEGQKLLYFALQFRYENHGVRLDIVHNPADTTKAPSVLMTGLAKQQERLLDIHRLLDLETLLEGSKGAAEIQLDTALTSFLTAANVRAGESVLMLNGRVIGPIPSADAFKKEDFQALLDSERASRILPVYKAADDLALGDKVSGPLAAAKLTSITALSTISDVPEGIFESAPTLRISAFNEWNSSHTAFEVGDAATATIYLTAVINPASEQGQKWAPILKVLSELEGVHLKVFLNPREKLSELPVKRFFRYVLDSAPSFDASGKVTSLAATFKGLPSEALLTAAMDVPPAWLVSSKVSVHDLDNIKLGSIKTNVEAIYELEHILIEGHSREPEAGNPPRGVQLVLTTEKDPHFADTIIMANLGFFQFKANPGVYNIKLEEGRSSEIFTIESVGAHGFNPTVGDEGTEVALVDFQGTTLYPRLLRKPGKEAEDVLEPASESSGTAFDYVSKGLKFAEGILGGGSKSKSVSDTTHAEINIFSVASGHLYERMLNIMMVSVMRHTKHTVKFWFIEQFLSPSFKEFIPFLAAEYGFKYEMVTYKWPHWLRQQKEKQREIWGYKILFLDVLFPLSLDKVIFVDADQIVRTDMYDLVQMDLKGAPYGFTPMCDSRTEMEGFRFWKQGYWNNYLKGQPYHISALYVVDLRRFREIAAGDRLRQQYHTLSADPNSLANLDQDLPNHMQFHIPIHSLPQEWLWCETWCSDESLKEARTIDLCNNPQTKEPKLDRARRQVPEWTVYDDEIAALDRRRKGLPTDAAKAGDENAGQKVLGGDTEQNANTKNTKSRKFEEAEPAKQTHTKDEL